MSALFDFQSFLTVLLLTICSCTYLKEKVPNALQRTTGFRGIFWKASRIGERASPWVSLFCIGMGVSILLF
uniref:Protein kish n=1 Tax=Tetraselmis sp. GSL018 TaxID=582737 RepID=A0A061RQC4_9CHLO